MRRSVEQFRRLASRPEPALPAAAGHELVLGDVRDLDAHHGLAQIARDAGDGVGVVVVRRGLHDGPGALGRIADLKMPLPTNTPSQPSCIISAASAGVAMPPAEKFTTGRHPCSATHFTSS